MLESGARIVLDSIADRIRMGKAAVGRILGVLRYAVFVTNNQEAYLSSNSLRWPVVSGILPADFAAEDYSAGAQCGPRAKSGVAFVPFSAETTLVLMR